VTRFAWLQFRMQAAVGAGALAVIAVLLAVTEPNLVHLYNTSVANCAVSGNCAAATTAFLAKDHLLQDLANLLIALPALVGMFWGAPLVARELETGTEQLVWAQGVTRTRWILTKLALIGLASAAASGLLSLMLTWWSSTFDRVNMNKFTSVFDQRDIVPIGYAAFAFALGAATGALIRRTLPAMATTLAAYVGVRLVFTHWVRPHLITPVRAVTALHAMAGTTFNETNNGPLTLIGAKPGAWVYSAQVVNKTGHPVSGNFLDRGACLQSRAASACIGQLREALVYQPASRYWAFQWYEMAIFLALAAVLGGLCVWWVRDRLV
jgi:hypothetical protein